MVSHFVYFDNIILLRFIYLFICLFIISAYFVRILLWVPQKFLKRKKGFMAKLNWETPVRHISLNL
jgi:hypothetical protein